MSIDYKKTSTVKKKKKIKETTEYKLGIPPSNGKDCQPSFVWALRERTGTEDAFYEYKNANNETCFFVRRKINRPTSSNG